MKYYLIAGEASGDLHASFLMRQLKLQDPQSQFRFFGGDAMVAEGGALVCHYRDLAYMGFVQVICHLPQILQGMKMCKKDIAQYQPDAVILVDYPGFNLGIAKWVKTQMPSVKVFYYISPKIWAWKEYRIKQIRQYVDRLLCILPFEVEWFRQRDYDVTYVGNPTVDELAPVVAQPFDREAFCQQHEINANQSIIALLPGSRKAEVNDNLPRMLEAATSISCHQLVIAGAPAIPLDFYEQIIRRFQMVPPVKIVFGETFDLVRAAEVAAVTSGTATLETAYLGCPQVVCYHFGGGRLVYNTMQYVLRHIRFVSLVNLLLDGFSKEHPLEKPAVPELLGYKFSSGVLRQELVALMGQSEARSRMLQQYARMKEVLGEPGAPVRAASAILEELNK